MADPKSIREAIDLGIEEADRAERRAQGAMNDAGKLFYVAEHIDEGGDGGPIHGNDAKRIRKEGRKRQKESDEAMAPNHRRSSAASNFREGGGKRSYKERYK